jgi:hypothetical protein
VIIESRSSPDQSRQIKQHLAIGRTFGEGHQVLEGELSMAAEEEREKPKQVKEEGGHRAGIVFGSELIDQLLDGRAVFWRGTTNLTRGPSSTGY